MSRRWSRESVLSLIGDYALCQSLWNWYDEKYKNKVLRQRIFQELARKYNTDEYRIKCKLNSLRSYFFQEQRRIAIMIATGRNYRPWYAYNALLFLTNFKSRPPFFAHYLNVQNQVQDPAAVAVYNSMRHTRHQHENRNAQEMPEAVPNDEENEYNYKKFELNNDLAYHCLEADVQLHELNRQQNDMENYAWQDNIVKKEEEVEEETDEKDSLAGLVQLYGNNENNNNNRQRVEMAENVFNNTMPTIQNLQRNMAEIRNPFLQVSQQTVPPINTFSTDVYKMHSTIN